MRKLREQRHEADLEIECYGEECLNEAFDLLKEHFRRLWEISSAMANMTYKGFSASITYDEENGLFVGTVEGIEDIVSFHGMTVEEMKQRFCACIEEYLLMCRKIGK